MKNLFSKSAFVAVLVALAASGITVSTASAKEIHARAGDEFTAEDGDTVVVEAPKAKSAPKSAAPAEDDEFAPSKAAPEPDDVTATIDVSFRAGLTYAGSSYAGSIGASYKPMNRVRLNINGWLGGGDVEVPSPDVKTHVVGISTETATIIGVDFGASYMLSRRFWFGAGGTFCRSLTDLSRGNFAAAWSFGPQVRLQVAKNFFVSFMVGMGPHQMLGGGWEKREEAHGNIGFSF